MFDRLRHYIARVVAPDIVVAPGQPVEPPEEEDRGFPAFDPGSAEPLGLRAVEAAATRRLEDTAEFLASLDPISRDRIIAYAQPKLVGRQRILTRHASQMDAWYKNNPQDA